MKFPTFQKETECLQKGFAYVAGCDEVGVGPLAGPVVAAACILDPSCITGYRSKSKWYYRVRDSKTTYEEEREELAGQIKSHCLAFGIGEVSPETIDAINIHQASLRAMKLAVQQMLSSMAAAAHRKVFLLLDGRFTIKDFQQTGTTELTQQAIVDGDAQILSISAASIIAKVHRDNILKQLDLSFPEFGFAQHKGYNTKQHREAIIRNGIRTCHRKSFLKNFAATAAL